MDTHLRIPKIADKTLFFITLWILLPDLIHCIMPTRSYYDVFTGTDASLQLDNSSLCYNITAEYRGLGFQRLLLKGDMMYIGATNHILQIDVNTFSLSQQRKLGPYEDDKQCVAPPICTNGCDTICTDNFNKLLLPHRDQLLVCGNTYFGTCDILKLSNISQHYQPAPNPSTLKCGPEYSQITRDVKGLAVASVHEDSEDPLKDLMFIGVDGKLKTYFPPDSGVMDPSLEFTIIDQTSSYTDGYAKKFLISWTTSTYSFVLWGEGSGGKSKIARLCYTALNNYTREKVMSEDSSKWYGRSTYIETNISCNGFQNATMSYSSRYGHLYVMFEKEGKYILCSLAQNRIDGHLMEARKSCFEGDGSKAYFFDGGKCSKLKIPNPYLIECGLDQQNSFFSEPVKCKVDLEFTKLFEWPEYEPPPTTIAVDLINGFKTGLFGTKDGTIMKAKLGIGSNSFIETITLERGQPVLRDVGFHSNQFLYAMTPTKIFKVKLSKCDQYTTCLSCLTSRDPYCGWCVLQNSCTQKMECSNSIIPTHWMKTDLSPSKCPHVSRVAPSSLSVAAPQKLSLLLGGNILPTTPYECEFAVDGNVLSTSQLNDLSTAPSCMSSSITPDIPEGQDHVEVSLRIISGSSVVATGSFTIYDCSRIPKIRTDRMCYSCVKSRWNCSWCSVSHVCNDTCGSEDTPTIELGDCPSVSGVNDNSILIPVGKPHQFVVQTSNIPENLQLDCVVDFCDSADPVKVPGVREGNEVTCSVGKNKLKCPKQESTVKISLVNSNYVIDTLDLDAVKIGQFNCTGQIPECGLCMNFRARHAACAWCGGAQTCIPQEDCSDGLSVTNINSCPQPVIESIFPLNGPSDGGTELTLAGSNLGSNASEISLVRIGSGVDTVQCTMLSEKYVPSKKIVCKTQTAIAGSTGGEVRVRMTYTNNDVISEQRFTFKDVEAVGFEPKHALKGTKITIIGDNLDVGNDAKILVVRGEARYTSRCNDRSPDSMTCDLPEVHKPGAYSVSTELDGFEKRLGNEINFVEEPKIVGLEGRTNLVSFKSGGQKVSFKMSSLQGIQKVFIEVGEGQQSELCNLDPNTTIVTCSLPPMKSSKSYRKKREVPLDDVPIQASPRAEPEPVPALLVINGKIRIPLEGDELSLKYVDDPVIKPIGPIQCQTSTDIPQKRSVTPGLPGNGTNDVVPVPDEQESETIGIELQGSNLGQAADENDYIILIHPPDDLSNPVTCQTDFLRASSLFCRVAFSDLEDYEGQKVQLTVKVGNFNYTSPAVDYCLDSSFNYTLVIAIIVPLVVVLVIIIIVLVLWNRNRAKKQQKEREQIMLMLDTLENKTRETARKAYFELQLGYMTTFTDNLSDRITYLPPVSCFMRALFNDWKPDHPMLTTKTTDGMSEAKIAGLDKFIQLIKNKEFLITLIKTLEEQKHFTVKEKGQFASLLTVCLIDDMVYFTRIMMDLLSDLIQRHVSKNPKLLLRRSESVVEKMVSHWLCINLYSQCIRDQAGKPLFLLTKAIHFLVNSAPCDVVANKAVNSLNEMTLLGTEVTFDVINLRASVIEKGEKTEIVDVKVVNCDTITQVKEKIIEVIFRDRPFSECPKPDDMELELIAGQGLLVLSDIDSMSRHDGNYTQINTLEHYNVKDGTEVVLSPMKKVLEAQNGNPPSSKEKKRLYHLINPRDKDMNGHAEEDDVTGGSKTKAIIGNLINRPFQEIYLTRMVKSKTTVQEYVDGVFNAILNPEPKSRAVKYFFQFLDREAAKHKINDPEVVHIWKTNSLLLRYWVNVLKNPEFLFDVNKTMIVDSCLNVITQAFMDACTTTNHKLGQDSPSNKLLYAKDAQRYRKMVAKFFVDISNEESISDDELNQSLNRISKEFTPQFNRRAAALQLFEHLEKYRSQVEESIEDDRILLNKLQEVLNILSPETNGKDPALMV